MKTKIYILEDNEIVNHLLKHTLETNFECDVMLAVDPKNIHNEIDEYRPDIVVLDYNLRFGNIDLKAETILSDIRIIDPNIAVVIFSGQKEKTVALDLIKLGAVDYVRKDSKDFHYEILESVRQLISFKKVSNEFQTRL